MIGTETEGPAAPVGVATATEGQDNGRLGNVKQGAELPKAMGEW